MQLPPPAVLAKFPRPNYVNPETKGASLLITNVVMLSVSLVVVGIRIYTRLFISRNFGWDDFFILLAFAWILTITALAGITYAKFGGARHVWDTDLSRVTELLKYSFATQLVFGQAVTFIKISMLLLTKKIMGTGSKTIRNIIYFGIAYMVAGNISYNLVMIFQCKPISAQFVLSFKPQDCINNGAHLIAASVINVVSDFIVVLIPIPVVLKLKMRPRQRAVVIALFGAGFAICVVGIVRTVFVAIVVQPGRYDYAWDVHPAMVSGAVEMYIGLICASIPPTRAFFSRYTPKLLSITTGAGSATDHPYPPGTGRSKRLYSHDVEKDIQMSDLSSSSRAGHGARVEAQRDAKKPPKGEIRVTVGVDVSSKDSIESDLETSSVEELNRMKLGRQGQGKRGHGQNRDPAVRRVESQTNLIGARSPF